MADLGNPKRARGEDGEEGEAKRLRAEELLEILDGDDAAAAEDLASVMRSFEEEIAAAPPPPPPPIAAAAEEEPIAAAAEEEVGGDLREMDLGYLLEASDDELGLPPTTTTTTGAEDDAAAAAAVAAAEEEEGVGVGGLGLGLGLGFGEMWGFEDEIGGCYEGFGFGMSDAAEEAAEHGGVGVGVGGGGGVVVLGFDGGLFDYSDVVCGPSDLADLPWRSESLPAV